MTTSVEINLEPVQSSLCSAEINVGDDIVFVTMCTKTSYIQRGKFLGTRVSKRTWTPRWGVQREMTTVGIRYMVQHENGRKTLLHYARMVPVSASITAIVGARL